VAASSNHQGLTEVLRGHVVQGKVDYAGIRRDSWNELKSYVQSLAAANPDTFTHKEQVAFWLNSYNALVIQRICEGASPGSVFSRGGFFRRKTFLVAGQQRSLDDIEHRALRPLAKDPRVHFVLVCGANSCPQLQASAFSPGGELESELENAARRDAPNCSRANGKPITPPTIGAPIKAKTHYCARERGRPESPRLELLRQGKDRHRPILPDEEALFVTPAPPCLRPCLGNRSTVGRQGGRLLDFFEWNAAYYRLFREAREGHAADW